ncbi:PREDICTED: probable G-protein coupled receptor 157 isoform X4 [Pseudopodoces humilis]|uniref:probable G-protein coupled receptor 157 isoform X4 n=1 Tax=Pseudopodoces humilis TaxID=181119 RepID=UPI0006B7A210|nr:PREDICTED: probable G-protein coupled receptor 157 isoform X4 [Pseudopodoces humilis]
MPSPLPPTRLRLAERGAVLVSCCLSCAGSVLLLCTQARWPELRTRPRQLLLQLSLADLLSALSYFYGVLRDFERTSWDCVLQGALSTFANTSSFFWTMAIALYLYLSIVRGSPAGEALLWCFHAVSFKQHCLADDCSRAESSWGVPLAITVAAVALKKIGYDASNVSVGWCWVDLDAEDRLLWMLLTGKVWEILAYVTLPVLYILIRKHINRALTAPFGNPGTGWLWAPHRRFPVRAGVWDSELRWLLFLVNTQNPFGQHLHNRQVQMRVAGGAACRDCSSL